MDGIILTPLKQIYNPKGDIFHAMKKTSDGYEGFGEAYFSTIKTGHIKGWKKHTEMTLNLIVIIGKVQFVIFDHEKKKFHEYVLSLKNYHRLTVKPGLWLAFKGLGKENIVLNCFHIYQNLREDKFSFLIF